MTTLYKIGFKLKKIAFPNPPKSISALSVDLSYSALTACASCQVVIFAPFEEVKVPVSNSADFYYLFAPGRILVDLGVVIVKFDLT